MLRSRHEDFRRFVDRVSAGPRRPAPFDFAHVVLPHTPLEYLPNGKRYDQERDGFFFGWLTPGAARIGRQRHLLQAQLADRYLGELTAALRRTGAYADTLIVVTSDHGAAFRAHARMRGFTRETLTDVAFSPLLSRPPGRPGARSTTATPRPSTSSPPWPTSWAWTCRGGSTVPPSAVRDGSSPRSGWPSRTTTGSDPTEGTSTRSTAPAPSRRS